MSQSTLKDPPPVKIPPRPRPRLVDIRSDTLAMAIFSRVTAVLSLVLLVAGLISWGVEPQHARRVLLILVIAMFLAILHNYTLSDTNGTSSS